MRILEAPQISRRVGGNKNRRIDFYHLRVVRTRACVLRERRLRRPEVRMPGTPAVRASIPIWGKIVNPPFIFSMSGREFVEP